MTWVDDIAIVKRTELPGGRVVVTAGRRKPHLNKPMEHQMKTDDEATGNTVVAWMEAAGHKIRPHHRAIDKLMSQMTRSELEQVKQKLRDMLLLDADLDPAERAELLSDLDTCPYCHHGLLGHNRPPADDTGEPARYRRQPSFDFD